VYYSENFGNTNKINKDIIIINIEDKKRGEIAAMLEATLNEKPKIIGLDVIFKEEKEAYTDSLLESVLFNDKIITSFEIDKNNNYVFSHFRFNKNKHQGFVEFNFDSTTTVIRKFIGSTEIKGKKELSFSSKIAKTVLGKKWKKLKYNKKVSIPRTIKYYGNSDSFLVLNFDDFLFDENKPILKDKIVLFGYVGTPTNNEFDIEDKWFTPLNKETAGKSTPDMHGIVVHANILNMFINHDFMFRVSNFWIGIFTFLTIFFSTMFFLKINKKYSISFRTRKRIYLFVFSVVLMFLTFWLFKQGIVFNSFPIIVGTIVAGSYFKYYKHLVRFIKTKRKWKSYIK
jgi:CHASE2 domain-containing sensor protein